MLMRFAAGRRLVTVLAGLIVLTGALGASAQVLCRLAVAGDVRPQPGSGNYLDANPLFMQTVSAINLLAPDLTVLTGDYILGGNPLGSMKTTERQWKGFGQATKAFQMPVYLVPGNHDIWDNASRDCYEQHCGKARYGAECHGVYLIALNTCEPFNDAQIGWLAGQLKAAGSRPTFVFLHIPLWWPGGRLSGRPTATTHPTDTTWASKVHPLLVRAGNVQAVIASHEHFFVDQVFDGIHYIISGGGGAETRDAGGELTGSFHHFLMIAVQKDRARTQFSVLPTAGVKPATFLDPDQRYGMLDAMTQLQDWPAAEKGSPVNVTKTIELKNPFANPMEVDVYAVVDGASSWKVTPVANRLTIAPGRTGVLHWQIRSPKADGLLPIFVWKARCGSRQAGGQETLRLR